MPQPPDKIPENIDFATQELLEHRKSPSRYCYLSTDGDLVT
jgi:hypothetical protein